MKTKIAGPLYLSLAAAIWGGMYVVSKFALGEIPPMTLLFIRYVIASIVMGLICWKKKIPLLLKKHWGLLFQIGFIGYFISIAAQFIGTNLSSAHMGSLITTLSPMFLSVFAIVLLKEQMTFRQGLALILAFAGVVVIVGLTALDGAGGNVWGILFLLLAGISFGYYSAVSRKASRYYSPIQLTTIGIWIATIFTFPTIFFEAGEWRVSDLLSWPIILSALYIGIISTAVAFFSWNKGLQLTPSHRAGLFFFLQPMVGSLFGWLFLHEYLSVSFFIGSLFILGGVYLSMREKPRAEEVSSQ